MSDQPNTPIDENDIPIDEHMDDMPPPAPENQFPKEEMNERLERLGGEPAPDITPEEFARLRQSGQLHIDPRGRVRSRQRDSRDAGVSLRKRRAWYG
ncbi:MAG: hypothetical protein L0154_26005 [Chloroflexi bacterium]|nr:hypothetical protein [Chloroflexota bacterium]